ncbi:protein LTV1 homolog [Phoenix dactylifera]|uniref:Protein LTV1 homolog n=1 Tax=Phoenix dactylifera TaxID=42345 RepID=A0A8B7CJ24_PHODC|nr:protein LTV1 homolog [Phoenix dactylifera]
MGRKKKFIDKKNSATFQLLARDSSSYPAAASAPADGGAAASDRVFVRVDNNPYSVRGLLEKDDYDDGGGREIIPEVDDPNSIFADAPGDTDDEGSTPPPWIGAGGGASRGRTESTLPDHVRREILELGLPDDGYNYLIHLREIKNAGGGSSYYHNSKARLDRVPLDVKAYDASRLRISSGVGDESSGDSIYTVASKTVGVKVQKAADPDVAKLLDDDDLSRFGSDVEDLEEDFVVKANLPEGEDEVNEEEEEAPRGGEKVAAKEEVGVARDSRWAEQESEFAQGNGEDELKGGEKPRVRRLLDEQFDLLTLQEYGNDSESDDAVYVDTERELLASKIKNALKEYAMDDLELEDKYRVPGDYVHGHQVPSTETQLDSSADVIRRCAQYAEQYCNESQDDEEIVVAEESSEESEVWDCETIVSTYSNLDNHPGKIQAPENPKRHIPKNFPGDSVAKSNVIALRGKEKLPLEYLPQTKKTGENLKKAVKSDADKPKRRQHGESKENKKERKAAVKEERREARRAKKELKGLYRGEAQRAQKVAAVSGPSSMHLM